MYFKYITFLPGYMHFVFTFSLKKTFKMMHVQLYLYESHILFSILIPARSFQNRNQNYVLYITLQQPYT